MAPHVATDDSDASASSFSYDSNKYYLLDVPVSPTASELPEIFYSSIPIAEHNKQSSRPREKTLHPRLYPAVIPLKHTSRGRTLVLCFDGTGDEFDADNSNIVQLVSFLKKDDTTKQLVYYQAGIGTYHTDGDPTGIVSTIRKTLDKMVAWSIDAHIIGGYKFLMQNYIEGDKICLFGFSRGAYTARGLAGMLYKVGLLPLGNIQQVPFAFKMYKRADRDGWEQSMEFKSTFSMDVHIEFIGVWDTVSSLGAFRGTSLPVATASTNARTFRHALSLDERRARFLPHYWKDIEINFVNCCEETKHIKTDVEEVWFAGCHCDVGGGSVSNKTRHSLARISLRWMIRECFKTNTGILFNSQSLANIGLDLSTLYPDVTPRPRALTVGPSDHIRDPPATPIPINVLDRYKEKEKHPDLLKDLEHVLGTEEEEELMDALSPKYDQLSIMKLWWIAEILPFVHIRQHNPEKRGNPVRFYKPRFGRPRNIRHHTPIKVHRSVSLRMNAEFANERLRKNGKKYTPRPLIQNLSDVELIWVD